MTFYEAMQLGASNLKPLIRSTEDKKIRQKYRLALITKAILCLLFCMFIVISFSTAFGNENSVVGVVTVITLLTFRFSNLDFDVKQSALAIVGIFMIFMVSPYFASISNPIIGFIINCISIITIVIVSCHNVKLSNQSIFILSYLLLYGYEVENTEIYFNRVIALMVGAVIVSGIFYFKQRKVKFENSFSDIIKDIDFRTERTRWQFKFTLVVCSAVLIGELMNLPKTMWIGFACMSIYQPNKETMDKRCKSRSIFMIIGCLIFSIIYLIIPIQYRSSIGIIGGIFIAFSATYEWQTVFNCFGALSIAVATFGLVDTIILRIINNIFGALCCKLFDLVFDRIEINSFSYNDKLDGMNI